MTREEFIKKVKTLNNSYYQKIWHEEIDRLGRDRAVEIYSNFEGCKNHFFHNLINNISPLVGNDLRIIRMYNDIYEKIGEKEFIEHFGEFKLLLLQTAIKRQRKGFEGYI